MAIQDNPKYKGRRRDLLETLAAKGIQDQLVLSAMMHVPRHAFMEKGLEDYAYEDKAYPIGENQTISQPYTVARQTELLQLTPELKVLEVGTGSGYQCAVLCAAGAEVYSIEYHPSLAKSAQALLHELGYKPNIKAGDGRLGWKEYAPFDRIIVTAGAIDIPPQLLDQLAIGGIMVIPSGPGKDKTMWVIKKQGNGDIVKEAHGIFHFVPLLHTIR